MQIWYFECTYYYFIQLYACNNKGVFKSEFTSNPYLLASPKHKVLRLKESKDEQ